MTLGGAVARSASPVTATGNGAAGKKSIVMWNGELGLRLVRWCPPVDEGPLVDARSEYVEKCWLPLVGPTCLLVLGLSGIGTGLHVKGGVSFSLVVGHTCLTSTFALNPSRQTVSEAGSRLASPKDRSVAASGTIGVTARGRATATGSDPADRRSPSVQSCSIPARTLSSAHHR